MWSLCWTPGRSSLCHRPDFFCGRWLRSRAGGGQYATGGLGTGNRLMHEPEKARAILGVPQELHFDVALSFGYPLHSHEQPQAPKPGDRKPFDELVFWERWANTASGKAGL